MACGVFGTINRRIGGLESIHLALCHFQFINRRIGGLENCRKRVIKVPRINRRIGGLEKKWCRRRLP